MGLLSLFRKKTAPYANTPYQKLGGDEAVRQLANQFYDIMSTDPAVADLYAMHPKPLDSIRHTFYLYLSMWLGGPKTYVEQRGHPRLRARHLSFTVTPALKEQWMYCMRKAMFASVSDLALAHALLADLDALATHMINSENNEDAPG
ncbi:group II truncated hemoglobin [Alteromonas halophila]|uniref:Globin n=1 Tax=Alteromonas halophila TaxID=516698 RepID=A0A918JRG8_9ALTE|nr:group II truncated hemoglobin [Alteromonas halophila]GGW96173.1 globin [Alteromonas halophila]